MKWNLLIITMLLIPTISATVVMEYSEDNLTNWKNFTSVDQDEQEGTQAALQSQTLYYFRARNTTGAWSYFTQRTKAGGEGIMASLAIMLFLMGITATIFMIGVKGKFTNNPMSHFIIKKCIYLAGIWMLLLVIVAAVTISDNFGLGVGVNDVLFRILWFAHRGAWVFTIYIVWSAFMGGIKLWRNIKMMKRMGYND